MVEENKSQRRGWRRVILPAVLAGAVLALYLPSLGGKFVYDDVLQIDSDDWIHDRSHFADVLTLRVLTQDVMDRDRPANLLSLMIDAAIWGRNPAGFRLTNNLIHAASAVLLFGLLVRLGRQLLARAGRPAVKTKSVPPRQPHFATDKAIAASAFVGALIFGFHPVNSEAVCVPTYREDLLVTFFTLAGMYAATFLGDGSWRRNAVLGATVIFCMFAAAASKENGVVGPPMLALYWLLVRRGPRDAGGPRTGLLRSPWLWVIGGAFVATGAMFAANFAYEPSQSAIFYARPRPLANNFADILEAQTRIWCGYFISLVWPANLCADYTSYSIAYIDPAFAVTGLAFVLLASSVLAWKNRMGMLGVAFFWLAILPASNMVPIFRPMADRYLYLPSAGLAMAAAGLIGQMRLDQKWAIRLAAVAACVALLVMAAVTIQRERTWHDRLSLWTDTIRKNPQSFSAMNDLGFATFNLGRYEEACDYWRKALRVVPRSADCQAGLAIGLDALGKTKEADEAFRKAVEFDPHYGSVEELRRCMRWERSLMPQIEVLMKRYSSASQPAGGK